MKLSAAVILATTTIGCISVQRQPSPATSRPLTEDERIAAEQERNGDRDYAGRELARRERERPQREKQQAAREEQRDREIAQARVEKQSKCDELRAEQSRLASVLREESGRQLAEFRASHGLKPGDSTCMTRPAEQTIAKGNGRSDQFGTDDVKVHVPGTGFQTLCFDGFIPKNDPEVMNKLHHLDYTLHEECGGYPASNSASTPPSKYRSGY